MLDKAKMKTAAEKHDVTIDFESDTPGIHVNDGSVFFKLTDIFEEITDNDASKTADNLKNP